MRLFEFAVVTEWAGRIGDLARIAEPERWHYLRTPSEKAAPILESFVLRTFMRVAEQQRIVFSGRCACFNTGLLTPAQEEIFGFFTTADRYDPGLEPGPMNKRWFLKAWVRAGDRLLTELDALPPLASYWTDPGELIFDPALRVELNVDHIVRENLPRFPEELGGRLDRDGVPLDGVANATEGDDEEWTRGASSSEHVPLAARNALHGAMEHSIRLARRSYRIAVPQFHRDKIQLLLPLHLRSPERADLALTLERIGTWYRAATVLYPDWAYQQARLISRPNSEWLGGFRSDLALAPGP